MRPETFEDQLELHSYAERHGLKYVWAGTKAFAKRKAGLSADQYEIRDVRTELGIKQVMLFSKAIV